MRTLEIKRILVPTDLSPQAIGALQYARFFAERFSSTLTLLNVDPIVFPIEDAGANVQLYLATRPDHVAALRDAVREYADGALQGVPYSSQLRSEKWYPSSLVKKRSCPPIW